MQFIEVRPQDHIVCLNISRTYKGKERATIYDCVRHYWRLDVKRAEKANIVLAIVDGIVIAGFKPVRWYKSYNPQYPTRFEFDGEEIKDLPYLGKSISNVCNPKAQNPVSYINI